MGLQMKPMMMPMSKSSTASPIIESPRTASTKTAMAPTIAQATTSRLRQVAYFSSASLSPTRAPLTVEHLIVARWGEKAVGGGRAGNAGTYKAAPRQQPRCRIRNSQKRHEALLAHETLWIDLVLHAAERATQEARDLHLRDAQALGDLDLRHALEEAHADDVLLTR